MLNKQNGEQRSISRLEGKLDSLIIKVDDLAHAFQTLEAGRLSSLEKDFAELSGRLQVAATIIAFIVSIAVALLNRIL